MHTEYLTRRFFHSLDGLRCIAILAVIWHHTHGSGPSIPILYRGFLGVDMFFALSGFLITTLLLRERDRTGDISLKQFYIRRVLRIFPLYYGVLALFTVVFLIKPDGDMAKPFMAELPFLLTYTSDWIEIHTFMAVAWSLAAEQQFYTFYPPVEKYVRRTSAKIALVIGIIAINQLFNFRILEDYIHNWFGVRHTDLEIFQATFTPICLGVLLAHVLHSATGFQYFARWLYPKWTPVLLLAVTGLVCNFPSSDISGVLRLTIQILVTLLIASCVIQEQHWLSGTLCFAPIRRIGVISYGMYLLHMIVLYGVEQALTRTGIHFALDRFLLCLLATIAVSELSFRYYEAPFLRLKRSFTPKG